MTLPPPVPPDTVYTSCYCEENVYLLCQAFLRAPSVTKLWEIFVVFISNVDKTVALWCQKAARSSDSPVIWDYHVVLILRPRRKEQTAEAAEQPELYIWVYDFDTSLDLPILWKEYFSMTFPEDVLPAYESQFRVVGGRLYVENFASDRSHMLRAATDTSEVEPNIDAYLSPPPRYAPICGPSALQQGITNNLMQRYVVMTHVAESDTASYGVVLGRKGAYRFFAAFDSENLVDGLMLRRT